MKLCQFERDLNNSEKLMIIFLVPGANCEIFCKETENVIKNEEGEKNFS